MPALIVRIKEPSFSKRPLEIRISSKVIRKAAVRNLLKRRIKAVMGDILRTKKVGFVIIAKAGAASLSFSAIKAEIERQTTSSPK